MLSEPTQRHHIVVVPDDATKSKPSGWTGEVSLDCLTDLVQLLNMARASGALHVREGSERRGSLWLDKGAIVDASCGAIRGASAVYAVLQWRTGTFAFDRDARPTRYSIELSVEQLLLEGMCRRDHAHHLQPTAAWSEPQTTAWDDPPARLAERATLSFQAGLELVQDKDYAGALAEWERAIDCDPGNRLYQANLRRLRELMSREQTRRGQHGDQE
jgi:hypothetical protein